MEPASIDWKTVQSIFTVDYVYEHIDAPKWVDLSALDESIDDEAWFCRPDCGHPKRLEDFFKVTAPKLHRSEIIPLSDRNRRDANLKRRGVAQPSSSLNKDSKGDRFIEDGENQNPSFTTPSPQYNLVKAAIKSSTEEKLIDYNNNKSSQLSSNFLDQITEFCNELRKLAMRAKEREIVERSKGQNSLMVQKEEGEKEGDFSNFGMVDEREKERKPLLEASKEKCEAIEKSHVKEKERRKKRAEEAENIPISLDVKNVKQNGEGLMQIRTCPPSPQCFSAGRGHRKATPLKASRSRTLCRGILKELEPSNTDLRKEEPLASNDHGRSVSVLAGTEERSFDVFWFLKPCPLSS